MIAPGAAVSEGQSVMELETDKAVLEVPSSVTGTVQEIRVKEGDKIKVGQVIFTVENGTGAKAAPEAAARPAPPRVEAATQAPPAESPEPTPSAAAPSPSPVAPPRERRAPAQSASEFKLPELGENI